MGYVRTIAHHTASAARHAGDPVWIRGGNGQRFRALRVDGLSDAPPATNNFDWGALIGNAVKGGADVFSSIEAAQAAKSASKSDSKTAAATLALQKQQADAALALQKQQMEAKTALWKTALPWTIGGVVALGVLGIGVHFALARGKRR